LLYFLALSIVVKPLSKRPDWRGWGQGGGGICGYRGSARSEYQETQRRGCGIGKASGATH
jgi:hypothetical protein